jgi:hypothetical protein
VSSYFHFDAILDVVLDPEPSQVYTHAVLCVTHRFVTSKLFVRLAGKLKKSGDSIISVPSNPGLWIRINFLRIRIRIQSLMLEADTDPDPIRIQGFNNQKLKKNYS